MSTSFSSIIINIARFLFIYLFFFWGGGEARKVHYIVQFYGTTNHSPLVLFRWFTVHNSFVYNVRLLFSLDTIGSIPPAVLQLSDGGHYENLAILPLLQRKLKRIVVVDGGYKDEEEDYGKSILDALMLACTELKCSFYDKDGKDVISDLMQTFVNPSKEQKSCYYKYVFFA